MKKFSNFNAVMGLLLLIVMLWTIVPVFADGGGSSAGGVPIVFGTEAGGGGAQVEEPVSADDTTPPDGFFVRYDFASIVIVAIVVVGVLLYRSTPPSAQKLYVPALDIALKLLEYVIALPGTKFDKPLQVIAGGAEGLQRRLQNLPPAPRPPHVSADGIPHIPPYSSE